MKIFVFLLFLGKILAMTKEECIESGGNWEIKCEGNIFPDTSCESITAEDHPEEFSDFKPDPLLDRLRYILDDFHDLVEEMEQLD